MTRNDNSTMNNVSTALHAEEDQVFRKQLPAHFRADAVVSCGVVWCDGQNSWAELNRCIPAPPDGHEAPWPNGIHSTNRTMILFGILLL